MKTLLAFFLMITFSFGIYAQQYSRDKKEIAKEIKARNKAVHVFDDWMRDPIITNGPDGYYYLTCTQQKEPVKYREASNTGVPVYVSKDLTNWTFLGYPYQLSDASNFNAYKEELIAKNKNKDNLWKDDNLRLWAPELHFIDGRWVALHTSNAGLGNLIFAKPGRKFKAPFTQWGASFGKQHDPTIFVDDDGSKYLVSRCAQIQKFKHDMSGFDGEPIDINPSDRKMGHEGAYIVKFESKYIFFGTAWSTDNMRKGTYNLYYSVSDKLEGPFGERKFAGRFLGHGTPFKDKKGNWWCTAFYNANYPTLTREEARKKDVIQSAYTLNKQGLTLVPIDIKMVNGEIVVRALDPDYEKPGADEVQKF